MLHFETVTQKEYMDINPIQFGYEDCEASHDYGPAIRQFWLLHFVVCGKGYFKIEDREYYLSAGDIFIIPPFVETFYKADDEKPWEYIWVGFTTTCEVPFLGQDVIRQKNVAYIFEGMKQCDKFKIGKTEFLCSKIWELFSVIMENEGAKTDTIENAMSIIHSEYMSGITVSEIARRLNLERTYFSYIFKKKIGVSPKKYILDFRMREAVNLLENYGYNVSVAAASVGYSDIYVFSKMFKQYYGVSPTEYLKSKNVNKS